MSYKYSIPKRQRLGEIYTQEELYREYYPIFLKMLILKRQPLMDAEDIAQDAFEYLLNIWGTIRWENLENLMSIILYQSVVRYYRQFDKDDNITGSASYVELIDSEMIYDPLDRLLTDDFRKVLQNAYQILSKSEKEVFYGFYIEDKLVRDLQGERRISTVLNLLARARVKISDYFSKHYKT